MSKHRRRTVGSRVRVAAGAAAALGLLCAGILHASASAETSPEESGAARTYYVDCAAGSDSAAGTSTGTAWKTLTKAGAQQLKPGDALRLKGGVTCKGTLRPKGSGSADKPVTVGSYGQGKARIDGGGAVAAVHLRNVQHYAVRGLEVTNTGPASETAQRVGVYVELEDFGTGRGYTVEDVAVHDVNGADVREPDPSGGIMFDAGGSTKPTGFAGITVRNNSVKKVDRTGIGTVSAWQRREQNPNGPGSTYVPMTGVGISHNSLTDIGGDGIFVYNGEKARIEHNTVDDYHKRSDDYNLGIFGWNSDGTVIQHNKVTNGAGPAFAFGVEGGDTDTTIQYNHTSGNRGGFIYVCASNTPEEGTVTKNAAVRYNISHGDGASGEFAQVASTCFNVSGVKVHNNTFHAPDTARFTSVSQPIGMAFTNNVFSGRPSGSVVDDPHSDYSHNLYQHLAEGSPAGEGAVRGDPKFRNPGGSAAEDYRLTAGSPALRAGTPVADPGPYDYFGAPVPATEPNIGADQSR